MAPTPKPWGRRPPNLLVLGASGHVSQAFLRRLGGRREQLGSLVLLDRNDQVVYNRFLDHGRLRYRFIQKSLRIEQDKSAYVRLLKRHKIDIVLDLTDMDTLPVFNATDAAGVAYINTALNDAGTGVHQMVAAIHPTRQKPHRAPHIISSGMNPGAVNTWVMHGARHYGVPRDVTHFEFDTSMAVGGWRPLITWSRREFLTETVWEPTGLVENGKVRLFQTNGLQNRHSLRSIMEPVVKLASYPKAYLVLHEENIKLGQLLGTSSRYLYAIHPRTMEYMAQLWEKNRTVRIGDLQMGDNTSIPLEGSDTIGVCLEYPRQRVYYLHSMRNDAVVGANATCAQVAVGVYAALLTMLNELLRPRVYFSTELYDTIYPHVLFSNLRVEHFVCGLQQGRWVVRKHIPELHPRQPGRPHQPVI